MKYLFLIFFPLLFIGCSEGCDDCKTILNKHIMVLDSNNHNLIFGEYFRYNKDSLILENENNQLETIWINEESRTIGFLLEVDINTYYLHLNEIEVDTISFDLIEKKDPSCCGNITYSEKTYLNGELINNADTIRIIKRVAGKQ